jgi:hypothetical protein
MGIGVAGDGQQHFIHYRGDGPGLVFGALGGVGELAHGIKASFEGKAVEIGIVSQSGFLHDAPNQVIGHEVHSQFAFDHVRGQASQHVHVQEDFDLAKMEFDPPAAEVEGGKVRRHYFGIEHRGDQGHYLGAEARLRDGVE